MVEMRSITRESGDDLLHILSNLREGDFAEISATRDPDEPVGVMINQITYLADEDAGKGRGWIFYADNEPVSAMGFWTPWPGVAVIWAFGSDKWDRVILSMTKHGLRTILPLFYDQGIHRAECRSIAGREDSEKWLSLLGLEREAVLAGFGRQREDFVLYVWLDRDEPETAH